MLVQPAALEAALRDAQASAAQPRAVRIVDATWYLPAHGRDAREEYARGHLPGAIWLDLSTDLADVTAPVRNTVADPAALARAFGRAGIGREHRVVVYDRLGGFSAGRVWWALRYAGHPGPELLDGGYTRWVAEGRPVTTEVPRYPEVRFDPSPRPELLARKGDVVRALERQDAAIVDARSLDRFRGQGEETTRHKGHIPGSACVPYGDNLDDALSLRPLEELRALYEAAGVRFDRPVITTCGSGVSASLTAFALTALGHPDVRVYDGSWAEWGNADDVGHECP